MNKKFCMGVLCILLIFLTACGGQNSEPEATIPPGISNVDGGVVSTNPKAVEGRVVSVTDDEIVLKVQGVDWKLALNEHTQWEKKRYDELDKPIQKGSFMLIYYEETEEGKRQATKLEFLHMN